jgi:diaminopimelate decarboxylase
MYATGRIDDALSTRDGHLFIEEVDTNDLVKQYGSPIFVVSEDQLRRNIRRFQAAFEAGWTDGPTLIMPAAKASWSTAVQTIIASEGCGADIYSAGEFAVALKAGFRPEQISVNGVPKTEEHIRRAVRVGARLTIDGAEEFDMIERAAREFGVVAKVRIRLRPAVSGFTRATTFLPYAPLSADVAALAYKGGLSRDVAVGIGRQVLASDHVELLGFHEHHGRHHASTAWWEAQMVAYADEIAAICGALEGYQPSELSIGGGFAVPRDPFGAEMKYTDPYEFLALHGVSRGLARFPATRYRVISKVIEKALTFTPNQRMAPTIEEYAEACTKTLARELRSRGVRTEGLTLQVEPGRSVHGNTGIHLTSIMNVKRMRWPITWNQVICDTTEFWFTGGRYEHHVHDFVVANRTDAALVAKYDVVGRSCYGDRLIPTVKLPADMEPGDLLALLDVGAYQEVSMSNFNAMPRPATLLVTGSGVSMIRRAESQEEVFARDVLPEHLTTAPMGETSTPTAPRAKSVG